MAGSGLQPTLIAIIYLCPGISGFVAGVRIWRKRKDRTLGGGTIADDKDSIRY